MGFKVQRHIIETAFLRFSRRALLPSLLLSLTACSAEPTESPSPQAAMLELALSENAALEVELKQKQPFEAEAVLEEEAEEEAQGVDNAKVEEKNAEKNNDQKKLTKAERRKLEAEKEAAEREKKLELLRSMEASLREEREKRASLCKVKDSPKIRVKSPAQIQEYSLESLGVIDIEEHSVFCLTALISDGAQILKQTEQGLRAFYQNRFEAFLDEAVTYTDLPAIEGRWSDVHKRVIPGMNGRRVLRKESKQRFLDAIEAGDESFELVVEELKSKSGELYDFDFVPKVKLAEYKTTFTRSKNRNANIRLAASALDGIFLMPAAEFSYNDWVGERSEERGFKDAPVIVHGQLVEGIGGGVCQVSSTIHAAALHAGLGIAERYNHSLPPSYIPVGLDSVVSYPTLDLRIRNDFQQPVVLRINIEDNVLIASFYGSEAQEGGKRQVQRDILEEIPFKEVLTVDPSLEPDSIKITKRGKVGYRVQRSRSYRQGDKDVKERLNIDVYQPQVQQVSIAPGVIYPKETTQP